jgi:ElaA protein
MGIKKISIIKLPLSSFVFMSELKWTYQSFNELSAETLYKILKLRSEVFVVEQNCVYLDMDGKDQPSYHLCGLIEKELVAYVRILPPGISYAEASIGRVCTSPAFRGKGAGRSLMLKAIDTSVNQFKGAGIKIGAQCYLHAFYTSLGFKQSSEEYIEDGIPHIEMIFSL